MNEPLRRGIRMTLLLALLLALVSTNSPAGAGQASQSGKENTGVNANSSGTLIESIKLNGLIQPGDPPGVDPNLIKHLKQNARGEVSISTRKSTEFASFVRVSKGGDLHPGNSDKTPNGKAYGFFAQYGGLFGIKDANTELAQLSTFTDKHGATHISYQQIYNGVPVFAAILQAHMDASQALTAMNGVFVPDVNVNTSPAFGADQAAERAVADLLANPPQNEVTGAVPDLSGLSASGPALYVYRDGLIQDVAGPNLLVYEVEVTNGSSVRELVYINAHSGKIVNRISHVHDALFRRLFEQNTDNQVWEEGDPFPGSLNQDQQNIVDFTGDSYYHFFNAFGVDSYDGEGAEMQSINNDPTINCPNANWNGATTNYCNGVTSDDVVAHEWGHAYTQFTHNLIYQWQPGALNESYSDIWGELVDSLNGKGTDSPVPMRTVNACSSFTTPVPVLVINSPASIAGDYAAAGAAFGPTLTESGVTGDVVLGLDASDAAGPSTTDACSPLSNAGAVNGNIALVDRGTCGFVVKVKNAQNAGATAVIVANNVVGPPAPMGGADSTIVIPSVMVAQSTGNAIKDELPGVNVTMRLGGGVTEESYRWLMGEDSTAFGGAIRDMWAPTCMGDPGKVSDAEYHCSATTDAGGVHTNSGVPNHGFALLVDGGTYNGHTVAAIGPVKAAHLYWQAQSVYQTPSSNFNDHADSLQASCNDLLGDPLEGLSTTSTPAGPSGQSITAADCAAVDEMIEAVELRVDPTAQCNFQPLLRQNEPALCTGTLSGPNVVHLEDFEAGLNAWTLTNQGVFSGWPGFDWEQATTLPDGRPGAAAFAIDPLDGGTCSGGAGDFSGVMRMESPEIAIPSDSNGSTRLAFDHYVATETGFDGGNLKISVNGGPYVLVPASAYTFNPYNTTLVTAAGGNTNPLAGQPAFSGTDGGQVFGSWGQSQIMLARVGVLPGDTIRLRYDFGMDGCTGLDGWYVDDVNVYSCQVAPPVCTNATASPATLTTANHKFRNINVVGVTDPDGGTINIRITSIFQDEAVLAPNSGNTSPDGQGIGTSTAQVRAERIQGGNGRVYHIGFTALDPTGGTCTGVVTVGVPASRDTTAVDDGPLYDSTQP
jgi:Zn-dependent metalloprotease